MKKTCLLFLMSTLGATVSANALFDSGFNIQILPPIGLDLTRSFEIRLIADPVVNPPKSIHVGDAGVSINPVTATLSISPFAMGLFGSTNGFANRPEGHAEGETGGLSHTISFRNMLSSGFQNLTFTATGDAILIAKADPGDSADASFGVSVFVIAADGTLLSVGSGNGISAPPNAALSVPLNFDVSAGPIPAGGTFSLVINAFAAGDCNSYS
jgi:hypothetical protein